MRLDAARRSRVLRHFQRGRISGECPQQPPQAGIASTPIRRGPAPCFSGSRPSLKESNPHAPSRNCRCPRRQPLCRRAHLERRHRHRDAMHRAGAAVPFREGHIDMTMMLATITPSACWLSQDSAVWSGDARWGHLPKVGCIPGRLLLGSCCDDLTAGKKVSDPDTFSVDDVGPQAGGQVTTPQLALRPGRRRVGRR